MITPRVTSRRQPISLVTNEDVSLEYAALYPSSVIWRNVTTDLLTGEEAVVHPINAPEDEVSQDDVK